MSALPVPLHRPTQSAGGLSNEVSGRIEALRQAVESAPPRRWSGSEVTVDKAAILAMLDELEHAARVSVQAAYTVVRHRDEVLAAARDEAGKLVHDAELEQEKLVSDTEVFHVATREANEARADAEQRAATLRRETDAYVADRLARFEEALTHTLDAVHRGRERLNGDFGANDTRR